MYFTSGANVRTRRSRSAGSPVRRYSRESAAVWSLVARREERGEGAIVSDSYGGERDVAAIDPPIIRLHPGFLGIDHVLSGASPEVATPDVRPRTGVQPSRLTRSAR